MLFQTLCSGANANDGVTQKGSPWLSGLGFVSQTGLGFKDGVAWVWIFGFGSLHIGTGSKGSGFRVQDSFFVFPGEPKICSILCQRTSRKVKD